MLSQGDVEMLTWWARYSESQGDLEKALGCYQRTSRWNAVMLPSTSASLLDLLAPLWFKHSHRNAILLFYYFLFIYPAWPLVDGALLVSKGGALPQTVC